MMGFQTDYVETIKQVEDMVQIMFEKLSRCCKYHKKGKWTNQIIYVPIIDTPNICMYYDKGSQRCERELCPLLEEEE